MLPIHKQIARNWVFPAIMGLGAERWSFRSSPLGYLILCYHGIDQQSSLPYNGRHIDATVFERHLQYYRRYFEILPLDEIFRRVEERQPARRPSLAISFDDGYRNNLSYALPLLTKYEVPATVFAIGGALDGSQNRIWTDTLDLLRIMREGQRVELDEHRFFSKGYQLWSETGTSIYDHFQTYARGERDIQLQALSDLYGLESWIEKQAVDFWQLMSPTELQELDASPWVNVQFHTHGHYDLAFREAAEIKSELTEGKAALENLLQHEVKTLAFPFGGYKTEAKKIARELGFKQMLALGYQLTEDEAELDILPRLNVSGTTNYYSQMVHLRRSWHKVGV